MPLAQSVAAVRHYLRMLSTGEHVALVAMRALLREGPLTASELVLQVRDDLSAAGHTSESIIRKVDEVWIGRDLLANWHRQDPQLVDAEMRQEDFDELHRPRPGARRAYSLTAAGVDALRALERKGGRLE